MFVTYETAQRRARHLWDLMPQGTPLSDEDWSKRDGVIGALALMHVPVVLVYALLVGEG
ncbi:MAG TPA: hypothetical protein VHF25_01615 [Nitriliruptorales bacterium]|nr:hypothetical protein [Nitriliruptorales bacterium]